MGVVVEPALVDDRDAVIALWRSAELTRPWNDPEGDFDLAMANPTSEIMLARDGASLLGTIMVGFDGHRGWVYYLAVDPKVQGTGIGRKLMQAAEDWLRALGCPRIRLMVREENTGASGFYETIGYEPQDVITFGRTLG